MSRLQLKGNEILVLNDPAARWVIETGSVALFGAVLRDGVPVGRRRFFFSRDAGDALLGLPVGVDAGAPCVLAVALEETSLRAIDGGTEAGSSR